MVESWPSHTNAKLFILNHAKEGAQVTLLGVLQGFEGFGLFVGRALQPRGRGSGPLFFPFQQGNPIGPEGDKGGASFLLLAIARAGAGREGRTEPALPGRASAAR